MNTPKVSVIVTVFHRTEFLHKALQSALNQTFQDFEILVTDDSRSAKIRAIADSFGSDKIRYRANAETLGVALNLRAAVAEAGGRYIAVLNDDDSWEPSFRETRFAAGSGCSACPGLQRPLAGQRRRRNPVSGNRCQFASFRSRDRACRRGVGSDRSCSGS